MHFAFVLILQVTSSINVQYILYKSDAIYTQRILLSNSTPERLINKSII